MNPTIPQARICVTCGEPRELEAFLKPNSDSYFRTCLGCRSANKQYRAKSPNSPQALERRYQELKNQLHTRTYEDALQAQV